MRDEVKWLGQWMAKFLMADFIGYKAGKWHAKLISCGKKCTTG